MIVTSGKSEAIMRLIYIDMISKYGQTKKEQKGERRVLHPFSQQRGDV